MVGGLSYRPHCRAFCPTLLLAQALHARALALQHPLSGQALRFVAPLHEDFQAALQMLGLTLPEGV
jgi:23S rRNA-/tRNA-specific pseudouridylate synthase